MSKSARKTLDMGWQGVFRRVILQLLPIDKLESEFSKTMGRPSKDLYSVCGLLLIMEFFEWSLAETAMHYMCDLTVQYAYLQQYGRMVTKTVVFQYRPPRAETGKQNRQFKYAMPDLRSMKRRKKEATEEFKKDYGAKRCPIEGLNGNSSKENPFSD